jgi:type I restriction enzyme M protein
MPEAVPGFCRVAPIEEVREPQWALTPGRYVGEAEGADENEAFEEKFLRLIQQLGQQFTQGRTLEEMINYQLTGIASEL